MSPGKCFDIRKKNDLNAATTYQTHMNFVGYCKGRELKHFRFL